MVTEHCARLTVEGPSRRGSWVVVVTDAVQRLCFPKGNAGPERSSIPNAGPLTTEQVLVVVRHHHFSRALTGPPPFSASLLEPKLDGLTGPSLTQIILSPTRTENVLSEGWRPLSGHAGLREPADAMVF
jgi:hypothetical protein